MVMWVIGSRQNSIQRSITKKECWRQRVKADYFLKHGGHRPQGEFLAEAEKNRQLYEKNPGKVWKDYLMVKFGFSGKVV